MKRLYLGMVMVLLAMTWLFSGCSPDNNPSPVERIDLSLTLRIYEWSDHEVKKAALIVHDANGTALDYRVFEQPEDGTYSVSFDEVPANGFVTVLSNSLRHLTWPAENDYDYSVLSTFPIAMVQNYGGHFFANNSFSGLTKAGGVRHTQLQIQGPCPNGASRLTAEYYVPHGRYGYVSSNPCSNNSVDASYWASLQTNGKASIILWPTADNFWEYIEPLSYITLMDKDPNEVHAFTSTDYSDDVQMAQMTIQGAPEGARVSYKLTAIKGGVPLIGFSTTRSQQNDITASTHYANVLSDVDKVFQTAEVSYNGGRTTLFRAVSANAFIPNDSWNLSDFLSLPDAEGLSLQQNPRLVVHANDFGNGNVWSTYRVWTISGGISPKYIYWYAYNQPGSTLSDLQFSYPELPDALNAHMPDIDSDYVSMRVSGTDYNLLDNTFRTQGRHRSAYRRIRDNLTPASAQTPGFDGPEFRFYPHERVGW